MVCAKFHANWTNSLGEVQKSKFLAENVRKKNANEMKIYMSILIQALIGPKL